MAGTSPTFDQARADFEKTWQVFSAKRTETDYRAWRDQRDWTERKYASERLLETAKALRT
jgi:hypothetical protein